MISWQWPELFYLLPLPLVLRFLLPAVNRAAGAIRVPFYQQLNQLDQSGGTRLAMSWFRALLIWLAWSALITAAARPSWVGEPVNMPQERRDLMLAVDKLFVGELHAMAFELFHPTPTELARMSASAQARYKNGGLQRLHAMTFPLPVLESSDDFAAFIEHFNRTRLATITKNQRPTLDLATYDVENCYPSTDTETTIKRRKEFVAAMRKRILERHGLGIGAPPINVAVIMDEHGQYQARWTNEPTGDPSRKKSVFSLARLLDLCKFLLRYAPFEFYGSIYMQVLGYPQGAPQSAIEVNFFVLGWDEYTYIKQLRDHAELELLTLFSGYKRYLDDVFCIGDREFVSKRYQHEQFVSPFTGNKLFGVYRSGDIRPFSLVREQINIKEGSLIQHKLAYLDYAVYQDPETGLIGFHLYDKRFSFKHDAHPVLRLPHISSFIWAQAVTGTLRGELHRARQRNDRLAFFVAAVGLMTYEDLRRGTPWSTIEPMLRSFWRQHHPFKTDGYGDEAGERYTGFKEDVLALVSFLWKNGSTAQDQRNNRIGWSPPTWITQANFPYQNRYAHCEHRFSWALRFIQSMNCPLF